MSSSLVPRKTHAPMSAEQGGQYAAATERAVKVWELRLKGLSIQDIADKLGVSHASVHNDLSQTLKELQERQRTYGLQYRALQLERLETLLAGIWEKAAGGSLPAIDRATTLIAGINKLLGLDAPTKNALTDTDGNDLIKVYQESGESSGWTERV